MAAVTNGAELVKRLAASGTPDAKLAPARRLLADLHRAERRVANAAEVLAALEDALGPDHMTVAKARQIADTGRWVRPAAAEVRSIEEELLAAAAKPADPKA